MARAPLAGTGTGVKEGALKQTRMPGGIVAVIPAAGAGVRMGRGGPAKQYMELDGRPILAVTIEQFEKCPLVDAVIPVVPPGDIAYCEDEIVLRFGFRKVRRVAPGGLRRQDSVRSGIEASGGEWDRVLIHDGVRPLVDGDLIQRVIMGAGTAGAVIAALPARETVKKVSPGGEVVETYDRGDVWLAQTPQLFRYPDILNAHEKALAGGWPEATDDALLVEKTGVPVRVVEGSERNIKITTPFDLELARFLMGRGGPGDRTADHTP